MLLVEEEGLFTVTQILLSPSFSQSFQDIFMNAGGGRGRIVYINPNSSLPFLHPELPRYFHECCWSERKDCLHLPKFLFSPFPSPRASDIFMNGRGRDVYINPNLCVVYLKYYCSVYSVHQGTAIIMFHMNIGIRNTS
jgi:hypothetical protein